MSRRLSGEWLKEFAAEDYDPGFKPMSGKRAVEVTGLLQYGGDAPPVNK